MLYLTSNGTLRLRNKFRREAIVINCNGEYGAVATTSRNNGNDNDHDNDVLSTFFRDLEPSAAREMAPATFFLCCREYMMRGVGNNNDNDDDRDSRHTLTRDIDHINNKKVSNAAALYGALLEDLTRILRDESPLGNVVGATTRRGCGANGNSDDEDNLPTHWKTRVVQYAAMAHRAHLLPFISRRTHIRRDWCEVMKRHMKNEMRSKCILTAAVTTVVNCNSGGVGGIATEPTQPMNSLSRRRDSNTTAVIAPRTRCYRYLATDVSANTAKMEQQFLCAKIHTDVEYDHELVKRMRVINLNAMSCLKMPTGFPRFFSYFNIGNIGNAGRVMNRTHAMRDSYVPNASAAAERVVDWLRRAYRYDDECERCHGDAAVVFAVNEIPILCHRVRTLSFELNVPVVMNNCSTTAENCPGRTVYFWKLFLSLKRLVPGSVVTAMHLPLSRRLSSLSHHTTDVVAIASYFVNIRLTNGIPTCPVRIVSSSSNDDYDDAIDEESPDNGTIAAEYCGRCDEYYPTDGLSMKLRNVAITIDDDDDSTTEDSALPRCDRHIWCSRHELTLYETAMAEELPRAKLHEVACHGLLSVGAFPFATDISKLIVAINAHKRALEVRRSSGCDNGNESATVTTEMREYLDACANRDWSEFDQNGKLTRFVCSGNAMVVDESKRLIPRNAVRLLFAFGDVGMLNCEDGYVLNERVRIAAETTLCRKIGFSCAQVVTFRSRMTVEYTHDLGARVHVGTFRSTSHVRFFNTSNANARVVTTRESDNGGVTSYDLYIVWNSSYLQRSFSECGVAKETRCQRTRRQQFSFTEPSSSFSSSSSHYTATERDISGCGGGGGGGGGVSGDQLLLLSEFREYEVRNGPIGKSTLELYTRYIRVILRVESTHQTIKLQNSYGQKGIARYADLSDLTTDRGESVDLVSSMYSLLGRFACGQLLEQRCEHRYIFSKSTGLCVGSGGYGYFFISDDSAHNNFIYSVKHDGGNPMRVCKLTYESFLENGLSSAAFVKSSEFECGVTNPYAGVPCNVSRALDCYGVYDRSVRLRSQSVLKARQRTLDRLVIDAILRQQQRTVAAATAVIGVAPRKRRRCTTDNDDNDCDDGKKSCRRR